jgi:hypothetical protein
MLGRRPSPHPVPACWCRPHAPFLNSTFSPRPCHSMLHHAVTPSPHRPRMTCLTLSKEQLAEAARRVDDAGLSDSITLLLCDYRCAGAHLHSCPTLACSLIVCGFICTTHPLFVSPHFACFSSSFVCTRLDAHVPARTHTHTNTRAHTHDTHTPQGLSRRRHLRQGGVLRDDRGCRPRAPEVLLQPDRAHAQAGGQGSHPGGPPRPHGGKRGRMRARRTRFGGGSGWG